TSLKKSKIKQEKKVITHVSSVGARLLGRLDQIGQKLITRFRNLEVVTILQKMHKILAEHVIGVKVLKRLKST
ncbi:hypothetical protein MNBD_ALPHA03-1463, partial [hydrothermal vent metagenome]